MPRFFAALAVLAVFGAALIFAPLAFAQGACMPRERAVDYLSNKHGESQIGVGLSPRSGMIVELWASADDGSFTIFLTRPNGIACFIAAGEGWETREPEPAEKGDGA